MKLAAPEARSENKGSALLAALCFCVVLGIALASYMNLCRQTLQTSVRNNFATSSFELAETGLEEALGALNRPPPYDWSDWTLNTGVSPKTATKTLADFPLGNGSAGSVTITIENYDQTGTNPNNPTVKAVGSSTTSDGVTTTKTLTTSARRAPIFVNALAATFIDPAASDPAAVSFSNRGLRFASHGIVDSIDSNPVIPMGETANAKMIREYMASFSAVVSSGNKATLSDADIRGYVTAATDRNGALQLSYSPSALVRGSDTRASVLVDQTRLSSSPYQPTFDIKSPDDALGVRLPDLLQSNTDMTVFGSLDRDTPALYFRNEDAGFHLSNTQKLRVSGHVILHVTGDFVIDGAAEIVVVPADPANINSSSLQIVITGTGSELKIGGLGIKNGDVTPGNAKNVAIFYNGDPYSVGALDGNPTLSTSEPFRGVIYAPKCDLDFLVTSNLDFTGALVAKTILVSESPTFHYDLDLRRPTTKFFGLESPFMVSSWQEVPPAP